MNKKFRQKVCKKDFVIVLFLEKNELERENCVARQ